MYHAKECELNASVTVRWSPGAMVDATTRTSRAKEGSLPTAPIYTHDLDNLSQ